MSKKIVCLVMSFVLLFFLSGCWSYRGLNEITVVAGVGIDLDPDTQEYLLSCEVIDLTTSQDEAGTKAKLVESRGKTVMDAVRNAKKRLLNKLYWGNNEILIIGNELAESGKLDNVLVWFLSDEECRETVEIVVSEERTAKDILSLYGLDNSVVSYEIKKILDGDQSTVGTIENIQLYRAFSVLKGEGKSLTLPVFRDVANDGEMVVESNGEAIFKGNKMVGRLSPEDGKYYLAAVDGLHGGILTLSSEEQSSPDISLEIAKSTTKSSYSYSGGKLKVTLQTETDVFVDESEAEVDLLDEKTTGKIEQKAQEMIKEKTEGVIRKVQKEYNSDIFGFGNMIYKKDLKLWKQLKPQWDKIFPSVQVEVQSKVNIVNTAFLKHS
ncbi:Ger(x)C family spore germination protein [Caproiciproducens sp. CPB-2]|uniref:Ger(x)C family spore germination protein n=1 Tax=Caproiciproducens sp. CPB-2 TaxID=3030017 RepID=UPI0023DB5E34|nr:Ger(x)C family spore germination protein [Caproiciproducens sp. CPB-2]MDF1493880.1 Ger(x)C family spore germination protein [Caproiciproducens sp. CPB-2]